MENYNGSSIIDTGQWQLLISISESRILALLKYLSSPDANLICLVDKKWENRKDNILEEIENAVYDNPRLLDDFSTKIIIETEKALWVPSRLVEDEDFNPKLFTSIYPADSSDIFLDTENDVSCLYSLAPGLKAFLQRTLPGSNIICGLSILKSMFLKSIPEQQNCIHVNIHGDKVDLIAFAEEGNFLAGATHTWKETADIAYKIILICEGYSFPLSQVGIIIHGDSAESHSLIDFLEEMQLDLRPRLVANPNPEIPLSVALLLTNPS